MKLTEAMKFLSPAIEKKNKIQPVLEHVRITQNYAIAYNGMLALAAPCALPLDCTPNGIMLEQAVKRFGDAFTAVQLPNGDLYFEGKKFKVTIPCTTESFPMPDFSGNAVMSGAGFVDKLKKLMQFTKKDDKLFPFCGSILLRDKKAYASCSHTLAFCPVDIADGVDLSLPVEAVEAMIEISEEPDYIALGKVMVVAYPGGRFLSCPPISTPWPDAVAKIGAPAGECGILPGLFEAIKDVEPFGVGADKALCFLRDGFVSSSRDQTGAKAEVAGLVGNWSWNYAAAKLVFKNAKHLRLGDKFTAWAGDGIEGRTRMGEVRD